MVDQPLDDGGRGKCGQRPQRPTELEEFGRINTTRGWHHMPGAGDHMRNGVKARSMRHGRAVDDLARAATERRFEAGDRFVDHQYLGEA